MEELAAQEVTGRAAWFLAASLFATMTGLACGGKPANSTIELPSPLVCGGVLPHGPDVRPMHVNDPQEVPGQMSEAARDAKRAYDAGDWPRAIPLLRGVAEGTADDRGNRQLAKARLGIALYKSGLTQEGSNIFVSVARDPSNAARAELLAWLSGEALLQPAMLSLFAGFDDADAAKLKPDPQTYPRVCYLLGRERFEHYSYADAMFFFSLVDAKSPFAQPAANCLSQINAINGKGPVSLRF